VRVGPPRLSGTRAAALAQRGGATPKRDPARPGHTAAPSLPLAARARSDVQRTRPNAGNPCIHAESGGGFRPRTGEFRPTRAWTLDSSDMSGDNTHDARREQRSRGIAPKRGRPSHRRGAPREPSPMGDIADETRGRRRPTALSAPAFVRLLSGGVPDKVSAQRSALASVCPGVRLVLAPRFLSFKA
jgi:hypothetical protein